MAILEFLTLFLCIIACIYAGYADLSANSGRSEISVADQSLDGVNGFQKFHTTSLLPAKNKHDKVLVVAPDGTISLMEMSTKKIIWSFASGPSIYSLYQALPNHEGDNGSFFIDLGQDDWELYMHVNDSTAVKLGFSAEELVRRAPYVSSDAVLLGTKNTTVFLVDAKSGSVIHTFGSAGPLNAVDLISAKKPIVARKDGLHEPNSLEPLYITRTDYALKYSSQKTGQVLWYLTFSDIEASFQCQRIEKLFGGVSSGDEICQPEPLVYRIRNRATLESILLSDRLGMFPSRGRNPSLPVPSKKLQDSRGKTFPALLHSESDDLFDFSRHEQRKLPGRRLDVEDNFLPVLLQSDTEGRILALSEGEHIKAAERISPQGQPIYNMSFIMQLFVFILSIIAVLFRAHTRKKSKSNLQAQDLTVQTATYRKKKTRKSSTNKITGSTNKKSNEKSSDNSSELLHIDKVERKFERAFDCVDSDIDGRKVGKILVSSKQIAKGSNGTIVLEGNHDGRSVAVKRLVRAHHDVALKEIQNLIASDQHPNIIRWFGVEFDQDFVYLSLERCTCSLYELISSYSDSSQIQSIRKSSNDFTTSLNWAVDDSHYIELWKANGYPSPQLLKLMRDIVHGLAHLHELGIIHRDLKPQNVLIRKERSLCAKVSDMGISKRLSGGMTSLSKQTTGYGSSGWQAPEQLRDERQSRAVDLFSLGCVLFFCITGGNHPFGDCLERDLNIVNDKKDLFLIENIPEAMDLVSGLLDPNPTLRPKAVDVLHHPLFWNSEMRLSFLRDASDRVELEDRESQSEILKALEGIGSVALNGKWDEKLENAFLNDIGRYRRYKYDSVRDLLRVIRNKLNHYRELSEEIRGILGTVPGGFDTYFSTRFPKLLIEVYKVMHQYCSEEESFSKYFTSLHV
ncbi:serine/threonine-protein kinase/endoribonuclease IRE1a-like [Apium graveolens]|uniref:serine/threonine-protein kinase/endoribonuclease IRE1a-like n=1 Tax=Apium graveolens TaxID=4045 RepID=UPI003D79DCC1